MNWRTSAAFAGPLIDGISTLNSSTKDFAKLKLEAMSLAGLQFRPFSKLLG
jgi:hypothetical protein